MWERRGGPRVGTGAVSHAPHLLRAVAAHALRVSTGAPPCPRPGAKGGSLRSLGPASGFTEKDTDSHGNGTELRL